MQTPAMSLLSLLSCWRCPYGHPRTTWIKTTQCDLSSVDIELHEPRELAHSRPLWCLGVALHTRSGECCYWAVWVVWSWCVAQVLWWSHVRMRVIWAGVTLRIRTTTVSWHSSTLSTHTTHSQVDYVIH